MSERIFQSLLLNMAVDNNDDESRVLLREIYLKRRRAFMKKTTFLCRSPRRYIPKCKNYFGVIDEYPDDVFKAHFRMSRSTFEV